MSDRSSPKDPNSGNTPDSAPRRSNRGLPSGELLQKILENSFDGLAVVDSKGVLIYASPGMERIFGLSSSDVHSVARWMGQVFPDPAYRERVQADWVADMAAGNRAPVRVYQFVHATGGRRWCRFKMCPLGDGLYLVNAMDTTEAQHVHHALMESEARYRQLVKYAPAAIYEFDYDSAAFRNVNDLMCEYTGYSREELLAMSPPDLLTESSATVFLDRLDRVRRGLPVSETVELEIVKKDGQTLWGLLNARFIKDETGRPCRATAVVHDITERKTTEQALLKARTEWENIFQAIGQPAFTMDPALTVTAVNRAMVLTAGQPESELVGKKCWEIFPGCGHSGGACDIAPRMAQGFEHRMETEVSSDSSDYVVSCTPVLDSRGEVERIIHIATDISDRRQAEEALRASEARFRAIAENAMDWIFCKDTDLRYTYVNPAMANALGMEINDILKGTADELFDERTVELTMRSDLKALEGDVSINDVNIKIRGDIRAFHLIKVPLRDDDGSIRGVSGIVRDVTEKRRAEQALQESERKYRALFEQMADAAFVADAETGILLDVNRQAETLMGMGRKRLVGLHQSALHPRNHEKRYKDIFRHHVEQGRGTSIETFIQRADGAHVPVVIDATLMEMGGRRVVIGLFRDLTEQRKLETQLHNSQKMEALGTLAGGIAHDFNNLLMGVQGNVSLMLLDQEPGSHSVERLKSIEEYVRAANLLTRQLLGFARGGRYESRPTDLVGLVEKAARMFGRTRKEVRIIVEASPGPHVVDVDRTQIEQVLLNILVNAWQAMPGGGEISIAVENVKLDMDEATAIGVPLGKYAHLSLADTGTGMDEDVLGKVFDPFFTTKDRDRGTGLGLASAYGIVKSHGGTIAAQSRTGRGSIFHVYLPAVDGPAFDDDMEDTGEVAFGKGTVLLVDDEGMILETTRDMIKALGYRVICAESGSQALEIYRDRGREIDIVILDLVMPEMGGDQVYRELKAFDPGVRVLLSSGYSQDGAATSTVLRECDGFIQKPFDLSSLSTRIHSVLSPKDPVG
ncbi:MAG: PAS domain S-box protein [Desulfatibacillaceae bacterium]